MGLKYHYSHFLLMYHFLFVCLFDIRSFYVAKADLVYRTFLLLLLGSNILGLHILPLPICTIHNQDTFYVRKQLSQLVYVNHILIGRGSSSRKRCVLKTICESSGVCILRFPGHMNDSKQQNI